MALDKSVELEITNNCNAICSICPRKEMTSPKGFMSKETLIQVFQKSKEYNVKHISIGGIGEPLLHKKLFEFVNLISSQKEILITLTTNGLLMNEEMQDKLINSGIKQISISLHGHTQKTYEKILGVDYDIVNKNINRFIENYPNRLDLLRIAIVKNKINRMEVADIIKYWQKRGIKSFITLIAHNRAGYLNDEAIIDNEFYQKENVIISNSQKNYCQIPTYIFKFIDWQGKVHICCNDFKNMAIMGDINSDSFDVIESRRKMIWSKAEKTLCDECNMPSTLLYTDMINDENE